MAGIKIRVATHDNDTTDIDLSRNGTKLSVSLGDKTAEIDIAEFIPATMADRFLADARFDETTNELVLTTRKEGEEDNELRVPAAEIFKLDIEPIFSETQNVQFNMEISSTDSTKTLKPTNLGRIKGTNWYVFQFDEAKINAFKQDLAYEANRPSFSYHYILEQPNLSGLVFTSSFSEGSSPNKVLGTFKVKNDSGLKMTVSKDVKQSTLPSHFFVAVEGNATDLRLVLNDVDANGNYTYTAVGEGDFSREGYDRQMEHFTITLVDESHQRVGWLDSAMYDVVYPELTPPPSSGDEPGYV
ncbi:hypothetical protein E4T80_09875 [Muribacter muris]|uniref:Uncharacterized protein n=1 Tax=Muribacter muris TaxID=67855 RepID=A0A4Y9JSP1_9PAST|nr:hypothetical protein [Muribacter muris]MBF0785766.1 hypothetical protein [Muribacter muris]MBF0828262.1 hypothetical protein [Muribacter muris]TFV08588.1 hypothetical protein E4T80_09875 [Muribacter muris]